MSNELQDFIEIHSRPKSDDKVYILEFSVSNECSVEQLSALENHLFYHLKEFTKKANNEANLNGEDLDIDVKPLDRLLSGEDYVIVPK
tara:strand:- start:21 stop:284 length:264 start_codon:yes stop_codon:yes gene_type:complete